MIFNYIDILYFVYSLIIGGHVACFQLLTVLSYVAMNICVQEFVWTYVFISLRYIPRKEISGSYSNFMFINLFRNC